MLNQVQHDGCESFRHTPARRAGVFGDLDNVAN